MPKPAARSTCSWHVLPSGGTSFSSGGNIMLGGSLGQFGAGRSVGGNAFLVGGFWNPDSGAPLAVTLDSFTAQAEGDAIRLVWETASEIDHLGFNLYRSVDDGQGNPTPAAWARLNADLIPSPSPGSTMGQHYEWLDTGVLGGQVYWYQLEAVDLHGGDAGRGIGSSRNQLNRSACQGLAAAGNDAVTFRRTHPHSAA